MYCERACYTIFLMYAVAENQLFMVPGYCELEICIFTRQMLKFLFCTILFQVWSYYRRISIVKPKKARMMQEYEFSQEETFSTTASTLIGPSEQVLKNILDFARCYQYVDVDGSQIRFYLN